MKNPPVILVTPNDDEIGIIDKMTAHQYAMLHRAFSVFIYRLNQGKVEILLQQRQVSKYHCGGLWTNACCSHPLPSETIEQAATRRLAQELGIEADLHRIGRFHYVAVLDHDLFENELDYVLVGTTRAIDIPFDSDEVSAVQWIGLDTLRDWIKQQPEQFTPWFNRALDLCSNHLLKLL